MISYTIDGNTASEKPTKGSGYVVRSITCKNGTILIWDNDNWTLEIKSLESYDNCKIDFTKDLSSAGTRVTLVKGSTETFTENYSDDLTFEYNGTDGTDGSVQTFTVPATGEYNFEAWGGQGGNGYLTSGTTTGALGGYSKGTATLTKGTTLYIYVGGKGQDGSASTDAKVGGYNGGGSTTASGKGGAGGGATHIATVEGLLSTLSSKTSSILMVAGGGGGSAGYTGYLGGIGGGTSGNAGTGRNTSYNAKGGTQTAGGAAGGYSTSTKGIAGTFGQGGNTSSNTTYSYSGAGGGGYYGGGGGGYRNNASTYYYGVSGGGGGSGYISTSLTNASTGTTGSLSGNGKVTLNYDITISETVEPSDINDAIESSSKTVTNNGEIVFYAKENSKIYKITGCDATIDGNKITIKNVTSNTTCTVIAKGPAIKEGSLASQLLKDNPTILTRTDFSTVNTANTLKTIYQTNKTEDGSDVYYFSGTKANNWVKFGELYWKIIRTNEDGGVRLLYQGTSTSDKSPGINSGTTYDFNGTRTNPRYYGYMWGDTGSLANNRANTNPSTIKTYVETWYSNTLLTNYDKYISKTAIYCNDRTTGSGTYSTSSSFYAGPYTRLYLNKVPSYKCGANTSYGLFEDTQAVEDKFSVSTTGGGNGKLTYPIALMTADEVSFAGAVVDKTATPWYTYNDNSEAMSLNWWTMSPAYFSGSYAYTFFVKSTGVLSFAQVNTSYAIRPVISLKACVKYASGDGTSANPYQVSIDSKCETSEN